MQMEALTDRVSTTKVTSSLLVEEAMSFHSRYVFGGLAFWFDRPDTLLASCIHPGASARFLRFESFLWYSVLLCWPYLH